MAPFLVMGRGRKKTPTALAQLRGNPGHRPINKREPQLELGKPTTPKWLTAVGKKFHRQVSKQLLAMRVLTRADFLALELLAAAYEEWREARETIQKYGSTQEVETTAGGVMIRQRPEVEIRNDAWKRMRSILAEFGLTPSGRTKLHAQPEEKTEPAGGEGNLLDFETARNGARRG